MCFGGIPSRRERERERIAMCRACVIIIVRTTLLETERKVKKFRYRLISDTTFIV